MRTFFRFPFRTRLLVTYLALAALPIAALGTIFYQFSLGKMAEMSSKHSVEIVRKTNEYADLKFQKIRESSLGLVTDKSFFTVLSGIRPDRPADLLAADRSLTRLLNKYFLSNEDLFSFQIATSYYMFGTQSPLQGNAYGTDLYNAAVSAGGRLVWVPTYNFTDMYRQKELKTYIPPGSFLFSAVMQLNAFYFENGLFYSMPPSVEPPVLIVSYRESYFRQLFEHAVPLKDTLYYILSPDGHIVSHNRANLISTRVTEPWAREVVSRGSGTLTVEMDGRKMILCFDTSKVTGWTSVVAIPYESLIREIAPVIRNSVVSIGIVLFALSFVLAFFVSGRIVRPIKRLLSAIKQVGSGHFESRIELRPNEEFGMVMTRFNEMNAKIQELIRENYESKLREKEAEITALNVQLNPHFLYNTLNIMNWIAIENDQKQLSKMLVSLSNMLHYTTQNYKETGNLQEEIDWLRNYLYIMGQRFEGKFRVDYELSDELYAYSVPRLFLHPIVENAILHGFATRASGGVITISGSVQDGVRVFRVTDNGRGMNRAQIEQLMQPDSGHVGLRNVDTRIKLLYGPDYGLRIRSEPGQGTEVTIVMPLESANENPPKLNIV